MNSIVIDQNSPYLIEYLKAQRVAYNKAKETKLFENIILVVCLILPFVLLSSSEINNNFNISLIILVLVLFSILTEGLYRHYSIIGAKIQEEFDTSLFNMKWNKITVGEKVSIEKINHLSKEYSKSDLEFWYSKNINSSIEENIAVIICQRINLYWDSELRQKWCNFLKIFTALYYFVIFLFGISTDLSFYNVAVSLLPTILFIRYIYSQIISNNTVIQEKNTLLVRLNNQIDVYVKSRLIPSKEELRMNQDVIYNLRKSFQKTPNWFYENSKTDFEATIDNSVEKIINNL